jgi:hypothetical protein
MLHLDKTSSPSEAEKAFQEFEKWITLAVLFRRTGYE